MCTVTFCPRRHGYVLAMNRDELLTRPAGRPPAKICLNGRAVLCPSEPGGGTWIAINQDRVCFALINWYSVTARVRGATVSRGDIIRQVGAGDAPAAVNGLLEEYQLEKINPFRLIGIFPATHAVVQWRWDLKRLLREEHPWEMQQWISSGFDEPAAQRARSRAFRRAREQVSSGSLGWLRRLHRSHRPERGPFSTCMHRADAATVSYTEVAGTAQNASMRHYAGAPCQGSSTRQFSRILRA